MPPSPLLKQLRQRSNRILKVKSKDEVTMEMKVPIDRDGIRSLLPHREPFLLVDRIIELTEDTVVGERTILADDPILAGHFPGQPVVPGVLHVEAMAQTSGILSMLNLGYKVTTCLLTEVLEARFRRLVVPGDCVHYTCKMLKRRQSFYWFEGKGVVDGKVVAEAKFSAKLT